MTGADFFWFVFSSAGITVSLLVAAFWVWARPGARGPRVFLLVSAVGYFVAGWYPVPHAVAGWLGRGLHPLTLQDVPAGRTVVVLLGSGSYTAFDWSGGTLSMLDPIGAERTVEAARVYQLAHADWVISSGGRIDPDDVNAPSGQTMGEALMRLGVPADRIMIERESKNTHDEAVIVAGLLPPLQADHVILVTSELHMRRSIGVFRSAGINAIPAIAQDRTSSDTLLHVLPSGKGLRETAEVVHELVGLVYYWVRGWYK